jgi:hypothetical protein
MDLTSRWKQGPSLRPAADLEEFTLGAGLRSAAALAWQQTHPGGALRADNERARHRNTGKSSR